MRKAISILLLLLAVMGAYRLLVSSGQNKHFSIGVLQYTNNNLSTLEGFKAGLAELGYNEGKNLTIIFEGPAQTKTELTPQLRRLLEQEPDLLFVSPTPAARAAAALTKDTGIPIVFAPVNDPVASGVVHNLRRPEANLTGVRLAPSEGLRLQSLLEVVPTIQRIFVPYNPDDTSAQATLAQLKQAAPSLRATLLLKPFTPETDLTEDGYVPEDADAVYLPREGLVMSHIDDFVALCNERGLPLSTPRYDQVEQGALTGVGFIGFEVGRQAARLAHLLLSGSPVANLPVETAEDFLFINLVTAERIGIHIPESILRRADRLIRTAQDAEEAPSEP